MPERTCAVTLDLEADHGWTRPYRWECLERADPLLDLFDRRRIPLTVFATGECIERRPDLLERLEARGDRIGLHSHTHPRPSRRWDPSELDRSRLAFEERFGRPPLLYRPPYGRLHPDEVPALAGAGIRTVSTFRRSGGLLGGCVEDIPVSRSFGLPATLAAVQSLGLGLLDRLPARAVIVFHLHDVIESEARAHLPVPWRAAYALAGRCRDPLVAMERALDRLEAQGRTFVGLDHSMTPF